MYQPRLYNPSTTSYVLGVTAAVVGVPLMAYGAYYLWKVRTYERANLRFAGDYKVLVANFRAHGPRQGRPSKVYLAAALLDQDASPVTFGPSEHAQEVITQAEEAIREHGLVPKQKGTTVQAL